MLGISRDCHNYDGKGSHATCPGTVQKPRPGITGHILYIHHPEPPPGESLTHTTARCACPCHKAPQYPTPPN